MLLDKFIFFSSSDEKHGAANQRPPDSLISTACPTSLPFTSPSGTESQDSITVLKSELNAERLVGAIDGTAEKKKEYFSTECCKNLKQSNHID